MLLRTVRAVAALVAIVLLSGCGVPYVEFSPDGTKLLVSGTGDGLLLMHVDGTGRRKLPHRANAACAIWSPDGRYLLYQATREGGNLPEVVLYDLQTMSSRALPGLLSTPYTFSHDGRQVVAWDNRKKCLVWLDVPSGERFLEVPCPVTPQGARLYWLPDRYGVAFVGHGEGKGADVYTAEAGTVYRISTTGDVVGLGVSPDGKQLLWARQTGTEANPVVAAFAYDLDARTVHKLPVQLHARQLMTSYSLKGTRAMIGVAFSPDARFALVTVTQQTKKQYRFRCVVLPLTGGTAREILYMASSPRSAEFPVGEAWSPDSGRIAFLTVRGAGKDKKEAAWRVRVWRADGAGQRVIDL